MFSVERVNNIKSTDPRFYRNPVIYQREDAAERFLDSVMEIPREIRQYLSNR